MIVILVNSTAVVELDELEKKSHSPAQVTKVNGLSLLATYNIGSIILSMVQLIIDSFSQQVHQLEFS